MLLTCQLSLTCSWRSLSANGSLEGRLAASSSLHACCLPTRPDARSGVSTPQPATQFFIADLQPPVPTRFWFISPLGKVPGSVLPQVGAAYASHCQTADAPAISLSSTDLSFISTQPEKPLLSCRLVAW